MSNFEIVNALETLISQATQRVESLVNKYLEDMPLPEWKDLSKNEVFYSSYREHVILYQDICKEIVLLSSISVGIRKHNLEDIDNVTLQGYSISAMKKMKTEMTYYTNLIGDLREQLLQMKEDLTARLKFFTSSQYLLTSPYNMATV